MKDYAEFRCADCPAYLKTTSHCGACSIDPPDAISVEGENTTLEHIYTEPDEKCYRGYKEYCGGVTLSSLKSLQETFVMWKNPDPEDHIHLIPLKED